MSLTLLFPRVLLFLWLILIPTVGCVAVPPGQPVGLSVENVGATWIQICWESPSTVDFPISRYEVIARATDLIVNISTPNNNTFVNVTDLEPGTTYNFTVVAVIEAGEVVARGIESAPLGNIMTEFTVPEVLCPRPISINGDVMVSWSYRHIGGLPLTGLLVMYKYEEGTSAVTGSVDVNLGDSMVTVRGLLAGVEYTFTVTAENVNGSSSTECQPVNHVVGVPVAPQFGDLITGPGSGVITVQIKTVASGVNMPVQEFKFRITPVLVSGVRQPERQFEFPNYMSGQFVSIAVDNLEPGESYIFSATAVNIFGTSESANSAPQFAGGDSPSLDSPPESSNVTDIVIGVVVSVIIPAIVVVVVVVVVVVLVFRFFSRNREKRTFNGQTECEVPVQVEEPDNLHTSRDHSNEAELKGCPVIYKKDTSTESLSMVQECPAYINAGTST